MAIKQFYIGSTGPFLYDDEAAIDSVEHPGIMQKPLYAPEGEVSVGTVTTGEADILIMISDLRIEDAKRSYVL